jgi:hypothetical protein
MVGGWRSLGLQNPNWLFSPLVGLLPWGFCSLRPLQHRDTVGNSVAGLGLCLNNCSAAAGLIIGSLSKVLCVLL